MSYLKYRAEKIFDGYRFCEPGTVLITDEKGVVEGLSNSTDAGDDIRDLPGILSPGFINCHCHLELSHMRGHLPEHTGLVDFVLNVVDQRHFPEDEILAAIEKAEDEMLAGGIVAVGDICNNVLTLSQKRKGRLRYHNFIEASGFNPAIAKMRFERSEAIYRQFAGNTYNRNLSSSIVPHAPYSVAAELWDLIIHFPGNQLLSIHNQETADEDQWFLNKSGGFERLYQTMKIDTGFFNPSGKSSLQSCLPYLLPNQQLILVHNVFTAAEDLAYAKSQSGKNNLFWCLCPNANNYISNRLPDIQLLIDHACDIVLGTDSLASNHQLSIISEIETISKQYPEINLEMMLRWATSNGAKALQMDAVLGSFEKGKRPGVVQMNKGEIQIH